jgi:hypothetical protein
MDLNETAHGLTCHLCGGEHLGAFAEYGSYMICCLDCKEAIVATSLIALREMEGEYEAVEVDKDLKEKRPVARGEWKAIFPAIREEAGKGKMVSLKNVKP